MLVLLATVQILSDIVLFLSSAGGSPSSGQTSMVDLNKIVKRWAWDRFLADRSWKQRNLNPLKYNQIDFEIDWSKVIFKHSEPVDTPEDPTKPPPPQVKVRAH